MIQEILGKNGKDAALSHVLCNLVKTENDTEQYPNIIKYSDTV